MSAIVILHSAAFWMGRIEPLAAMLSDFTLTFSLYPRPLFGGPVRLLLFTVIPAGFVGWLPVESVRDPSLAAVAGTIAGTALLMTLAAAVFSLGLRRYESGNRFGIAG
jgi:ABC-2 type transport system permease protein